MKNILPILLLVGLTNCTTPRNTLENYKIAYNVAENAKTDDYEVYVMNTDGTGKANITRHPDVAWSYHAYNDKLYWISDRDTCRRCYYLYVSDAAGKGVRKVTGLRLEDSWMSARNKGRELIVAGRIDKQVRYQLFTVNAETGQFKQITTDTAAMYADPVFSPDGRQIVYRYKRKRLDRNEKAELWIAQADGANPRQLTHYPATDTTAQWHSYHAGPPHWNARLDLITYQSKQNGKYRLMAVSPDGEKNYELFDFGMGAGWHDWSPDGRWLAVELFPDDNSPGDIYLWNYESKALSRLTDGPGYEQSPVWVKK